MEFYEELFLLNVNLVFSLMLGRDGDICLVLDRVLLSKEVIIWIECYINMIFIFFVLFELFSYLLRGDCVLLFLLWLFIESYYLLVVFLVVCMIFFYFFLLFNVGFVFSSVCFLLVFYLFVVNLVLGLSFSSLLLLLRL